jgi:hypothetical protein
VVSFQSPVASFQFGCEVELQTATWEAGGRAHWHW